MGSSMQPPSPIDGAALAEGLYLAGKPLDPPLFHHVRWKVNQVFSPADDPDRTAEPWKPPSFIDCDPTARHSEMSAEEIELPTLPSRNSFARVVRGALREDECAELIRYVNMKGFTPALLNIGGGHQQLVPDARDGFRVIVDIARLAGWILEVLRPYIPNSIRTGSREVRLESLNERCRFLCYTPGQEFPEHHDARFTHPRTRASSMVTVQLYLHDVAPSSGGSTTFLFGRNISPVKCQPGAGSVLIFTQDLLHEGSLLKHGLKYTFRTEAMYT